METIVDDDGNNLFSPTFRFTVREQTYTVNPIGHISPRPGAVGDEVGILYRPNNPRKAVMNRFAYTWFVPSFLLGFGLLLLTFDLMLTLIRLVWINLRNTTDNLGVAPE